MTMFELASLTHATHPYSVSQTGWFSESFLCGNISRNYSDIYKEQDNTHSIILLSMFPVQMAFFGSIFLSRFKGLIVGLH